MSVTQSDIDAMRDNYRRTLERVQRVCGAAGAERVRTSEALARGYVWGLQDGAGAECDTAVSQGFGAAFGTMTGLYLLGQIGVAHNPKSAWRSWNVTGRILDSNGAAMDVPGWGR